MTAQSSIAGQLHTHTFRDTILFFLSDLFKREREREGREREREREGDRDRDRDRDREIELAKQTCFPVFCLLVPLLDQQIIAQTFIAPSHLFGSFNA